MNGLMKIKITAWHYNVNFVGNKAKGRISKRVFQESKARQNFRKTNISYPLIRTRTCAYQGVRNVCFSEILACFAFLKHPFWDSPFDLFPTVCRSMKFRNLWRFTMQTLCWKILLKVEWLIIFHKFAIINVGGELRNHFLKSYFLFVKLF